MLATFETDFASQKKVVETVVLVRGQGKNGEQLKGGDWKILKYDIQ